MSKLAKALEVQSTNQRAAIMPILTLKEDFARDEAYFHHDTVNIYRIGVTLSVEVRSTHEEVLQGTHSYKIKRAKEQIIREVFGEFVSKLSLAENAILSHDPKEAMRLIGEVVSSFTDPEK